MPPQQVLMGRTSEAPSRSSRKRKSRQNKLSGHPVPVIIAIKIKAKGSHEDAQLLTGMRIPSHSAVQIPLVDHHSFKGKKSGAQKHTHGKDSKTDSGRKKQQDYTKQELTAINQLEKVQAFKHPDALKAALEIEKHQPPQLEEIDPSFYDKHEYTKEKSKKKGSQHADSEKESKPANKHNNKDEIEDEDDLTDQDSQKPSSHTKLGGKNQTFEKEDKEEDGDSDSIDDDDNDNDDEEKPEKESSIEDQSSHTSQNSSSKKSKARVHAQHSFTPREAAPGAQALGDPEVWT
ncbi:hypothetical protein MMC10_010914 [Thelotrema lepadinum]|nr:hypothetical protein [Thelotrema lepadinum]